MPRKIPSANSGPLALQLEVEFLDRLTEPVRDKKARSVSAIIRAALERYDFANMVIIRPAQVLISVRLPGEIRRTLKRTARAKHTSVGQLVRSAVEAYLPDLETGTAGQLEMPIIGGTPSAQPASKRAVRARPRHAKRRRKAKIAAGRPGPRSKPAARNMTKKRKG